MDASDPRLRNPKLPYLAHLIAQNVDAADSCKRAILRQGYATQWGALFAGIKTESGAVGLRKLRDSRWRTGKGTTGARTANWLKHDLLVLERLGVVRRVADTVQVMDWESLLYISRLPFDGSYN